MRRISVLMISGMFLGGCAGFGGTSPSLWSMIESSGHSEPKLTAYEQGKRDLQLGSFGLAIGAFQKELAENPNSIPALNGLAIAYDRLGRHDIAQRYLDLALTLDPNAVVTLNNLAYLNLTQGNPTVAADYGRRARVAVSAGEMRVTDSVAAAVSNNLAIAADLAMNDAKVAFDVPSPSDMPSEIRQIAANEWQLNIPPMELAEAVPAAAPGMPILEDRKADPMEQLSQNAVLRVTNGTGRNLMATRFAGYLSTRGLKVQRLANAASFNYKESAIYYNPDQRDFALALSRLLPFSIKLAEAAKGSGQIEIVLGSDLLRFDDDLRST